MIYVGIDPGASGATAKLKGTKCNIQVMPKTPRRIVDGLDPVDTDVSNYRCAIEKVWARPGDGNAGMFKFGVNYGVIIGALEAFVYLYEEVTPQTWQRGLGINPQKKSESKSQFKNRLKSIAQRLFPSIKLTLKTCDALLIAEYCRRKHEGGLR